MCETREALEEAFRAALAAGHEGIVAKAPDSLYTPGRRGRFWFKLKEPFATLDVVVTAVEYGHGKRHGVLSDYTFAVREGDRLLNVGKAYSGLTDAEIREFTDYFLQAYAGRPGIPANRRAESRAGGGLQQHTAIEAARKRIRASISANRAHASG